MKVNPLFVLREIADEYIVVPVGEEADRVHGVLTLNEQGAFLWKLMESEQTEKSLLDAMVKEFAVEEDTAQADIADFLLELQKIGCLQ